MMILPVETNREKDLTSKNAQDLGYKGVKQEYTASHHQLLTITQFLLFGGDFSARVTSA